MELIDAEIVVVCDIDDTLVMWGGDHTRPDPSRIELVSPYSGTTVYLKPHWDHVELLKQYKGRGFEIILWSAGGAKWAYAVGYALGLQDVARFAMTKPMKHLDDLTDVNHIVGNRVYLNFKELTENKVFIPALPPGTVYMNISKLGDE